MLVGGGRLDGGLDRLDDVAVYDSAAPTRVLGTLALLNGACSSRGIWGWGWQRGRLLLFDRGFLDGLYSSSLCWGQVRVLTRSKVSWAQYFRIFHTYLSTRLVDLVVKGDFHCLTSTPNAGQVIVPRILHGNEGVFLVLQFLNLPVDL